MLVIHYLKHIKDLERKLREKQKELDERKQREKDLEEKIGGLKGENEELRDRIKTIENRISSKQPRFSENYSLSKQEDLLVKSIKNQEKKKSTGRRKTSLKKKEAQRFENIYPEELGKKDSLYVYDRVVMRLENGKAIPICYHIYREMNGSKVGKPKGVPDRVEFGIEIIIALSFLVYELHLSQDQAAQVMNFFTGLEIESSQIDSLFTTLSNNWNKEFEAIKNLILFSLIVYIDETGWKISAQNVYTWIFKSLDHTILLFGESRKEEVLDSILPLNLFKGIAGSDCYGAYMKRFKRAQKCWAHFLRDAIKIMLMHPEKKEYEKFFKKLLKIFREAKKTKSNEKLSFKNKENKVEKYLQRIKILCNKAETKMNKETDEDVRKFVNLQKRLVKNKHELFTFVTTEIEPTNNTAEQGLRGIAKSRNNYQTSKTKKGATKRSIITSVLASLKQNLEEFSIHSVTEEVKSWMETGESLFEKQLKTLQENTS